MNKQLAKQLLNIYQDGLRTVQKVRRVKIAHEKLYTMGIGYCMGDAAQRVDYRFYTRNPGWAVDTEVCGKQPCNCDYKPDIHTALKNRIALLEIYINKQ